MARATAAGWGRNPASAAEGIIPGIRARNCITSTISYLHRQRTVPGRPRAEQLPGPPAAGAENRDEPWRPLGAPKLISKPGTAFVTTLPIFIPALKPKREHPKNARNLWAPHPGRGHRASSTLEDPRARRGLC